MTPDQLRRIEFTRKPARWDDVYHCVPAHEIPPGLPRYTSAELGIQSQTLRDFAKRPDATLFLVEHAGTVFLVNAEGYRYARYAAKVIP